MRQLAGWHRIREVTAKRLRLLHDLVPKAVRVAVLLNPTNVSAAEATSPFPPSCVASFALAVFFSFFCGVGLAARETDCSHWIVWHMGRLLNPSRNRP